MDIGILLAGPTGLEEHDVRRLADAVKEEEIPSLGPVDALTSQGPEKFRQIMGSSHRRTLKARQSPGRRLEIGSGACASGSCATVNT